MTRYSNEPRDEIFVKGYRFLSFTKNISENIGKNVSGKYSKKPLGHAKAFAREALNTTSKRVNKK